MVSHSLVVKSKESGATLPRLKYASAEYFRQISQAFSASVVVYLFFSFSQIKWK